VPKICLESHTSLIVNLSMPLDRLDGNINKTSYPAIHFCTLFINTFSCMTTDFYFISSKIKIIK